MNMLQLPLRRLVFILAMLAGIALRLIWPADMEWKEDEKDMYRMGCEAAVYKQVPPAGMRSGGGLVNPGFSVVPFALFAAVSSDPVHINQLVQLVNVLALLGFAWFALVKIPPP